MKKKFSCLFLMFIIAASLISFPVLGFEKWIRQSEIHPRISDNAAQSEITFANFQSTWYFDGAMNESGNPEDGWLRSWLRNSGSRWGCRNWRDPETGSIYPIKLGGAPYAPAEADLAQWGVPDEGILIRKYYRYHPPKIIVNGIPVNRAYPTPGDYHAPEKVWGTADVMVESHARNWLGLDIYQRVLSWVSKNHNQYVIYDWTIVNTGNIDEDPEIEREGESLDSLYFMRQLEMTVTGEAERKAEWYTWTGVRPDGSAPRDSVRCLVSYPAVEWYRGQGNDFRGDAFGVWTWDRDYIDDASSGGEVTLYSPQTDVNHRPIKPIGPGPGGSSGNPENYPATDDVTQPRSHGRWGPDDGEFREHSGSRPEEDWVTIYNAMVYGEKGDPTYEPLVEYMEGTYPNTCHPIPTDERGYRIWNDQETENSAVYWHAMAQVGYGPYNLDYGDSIRIVWAHCGGRLSTQAALDVGRAWKDSSITFITQSGAELDTGDISFTFPYVPNPADTIHIPPIYRHQPGRWQDDLMSDPVTPDLSDDRANLIKDMWVYSTVDSVIRHAINAQWNFDHDYKIPTPPPPPSIEIKSLADRITIDWWYEVETDVSSDLAGFKVYRSVGRGGPMLTNDGVVGEWQLIFQCGGSNPGGGVGYNSFIVYTYNDTTAVRGEDYFYYVAAFDDGTHPESDYPGDVTGTSEPLESGRWQNYTYGVIGAASPVSVAESDLSKVRVVPNPFNAASTVGRYAEKSDKINFFNLTENCTIRIYTFTGDLVKTIVHRGSGDEAWVNPTRQIYQVTDQTQHIVSGLYIANIVDDGDTGESVNVKFVIIR